MRGLVDIRGWWLLAIAGIIGLIGVSPPTAAAAELPVASVTASEHDGNAPANALDDDPGTRWSAEGEGQWIRFDLGMERTVREISVAWFRGDQRRSRFVVQTSTDGNDWQRVFRGRSSGSTTEPERYTLEESQARFVRIVGYGNSWEDNKWNSITAFTAHGEGAGGGSRPDGMPVATVTASADDGNVPVNTLDGDLDTRWSAEGEGQWIRYDLGEARNVGAVAIAWFRGDQRQSHFAVQTSTDGDNWQPVFEGSSSGRTNERERYNIDNSTARYVRIVGHGNSWPSNEWNSITTFAALPSDTGSENEAPVASGDSYSIDAGRSLQVGAGDGVLANDSDPDGDELTAAQVEGPAHGSLALNADGSCTYTPDAGFSGDDGFTYVAGDGQEQTDPMAVSIKVNAIDHTTPLEIQSVEASADDGNVAANVLDGDLGTRWSAEGDGQHIDFDLGAQRSVEELAVAWFRGNERRSHFEVQTSSDGSSWDTVFEGSSSGRTNERERYNIDNSTARYVRIVGRGNSWEDNDWNSITEVDIFSEEAPDEPDPPIAEDDGYRARAGEELTIGSNNGVLANDSDPDGDHITAELKTGPEHGSLRLNEDGGFTYTPDDGYTGTDGFTYRASDGELTSETAVVAITVRPGGSADEGWTELSKSDDTRVIYVSRSEGDDSNSGLSPNDPVQSLGAGYSKLRSGQPDWMLLKCGDRWKEKISRWTKGGRSKSEPMVLSSYGEGPRPVITRGIEVHSGTNNRPVVRHLAFVDIAFIAEPDNQPEQGFFWRGRGGDMLIEGCRFEYNNSNINILRRGGDLKDFRIRRNVIANAYHPGDGYSQGLFANQVDTMVIEGNVFDNNGWEEAHIANDGDVTGDASIFNHNNYLTNLHDVVIRNNIYANGSGLGIKMAANAGRNAENFEIRNNLFVDNGYGVSLNSNNIGEYIHREFTIERNVFSLMGHHYDDRGFRARALEMFSTRNGTIQDNYILRKRQEGGGQAMIVDDLPHRNLMIQRNVVFEWPIGKPKKLIWIQDSQYEDEIAVEGNHENFDTDRYYDASRSTAAYNKSIGGRESLDAFLEEARKLRKGHYRPEYTARPVVDFIADGFTLLPTRD